MVRLHKSMKVETATKAGIKDAACHVRLATKANGKGKLTATNGHVSVVIPVQLDTNDKTGLIDTETVQAARKHVPRDAKSDGYMQLLCGDRVELPTADQIHGRPTPNGTLFNEHQIKLPKLARDGCAVVRVNVTDLATAAAALGCTTVDVRYIPDAEEKGIRVDPVETEHPGAAAVIMPRTNLTEDGAQAEDDDAELDAKHRPPSVAEARAAQKAKATN